MRLIYIANIRLPTEKAHGLQIMKTCEALVKQGIEVELVVPRRLNHLKDDPFSFYGVEKNFKITKVWCLDLISLKIFGKLGFWIESWTFYRSVKKYLREQGATVYYTRDLSIAYWLSKITAPVYYEVHTLPNKISSRYKEAWERCKGLIVISDGLKNELVRHGVAEEKILLARDAVDLRQFKKTEEKTVWRREFGMPPEKVVVLYAGHFYEWKGAATLAEAAKFIPEMEVYLVGGTDEDSNSFRIKYGLQGNIHIIGWTLHNLIPAWLMAADILVLPNSGKSSISRQFTSPMKLFEYMAAERPIVASNLPSLREVLDDTTAFFFTPDNPNDLARTLREVASSSTLAEKRATRAYELAVEKYAWDKRAETIKNFIFARHE